MPNMFNTTITSDDQDLGFVKEEVENPDTYYLSLPTISAVVKKISPVERIIKTNTSSGRQEYLHQWKDESKSHGNEWSPCCRNDVSLKNEYEDCRFYGKFQNLITILGTAEARNAVLRKELNS